MERRRLLGSSASLAATLALAACAGAGDRFRALADEALRDTLATRFPDAWARITARREFMARELGIELAPEVLPLSDMPAYLAPFALRPDHVLTLM